MNQGALYKKKIPIGVRCIIFSFIPILELLSTTSKLSIKDRRILADCKDLD